jgi:hypothetical protein
MRTSCLVLALVTLSTVAGAQDSATAEAMFKHGLAELKAGHFDKACPALDESFRLDPRAGTLFTSAECDFAWGKLATALARYDEYLSFVDRLPADQRTRQAERVKAAKDKKHALESEVPRMTVIVQDPPAGLVVKRDNLEQRPATFGIALPVDPGEHVVTAEAPDRTPRTWKVSVPKGAKESVAISLELAAAAAPSPGPSAANTAPAAPASVAQSSQPPSRVPVYVAGGVGIVGIVVGAVAGGMAMSQKKTIDNHCVGKVCDQQGYDAVGSIKTTGLISTVGFGVGVAGLAVGGFLLWYQSGKGKERTSPAAWTPVVELAPGVGYAGIGRAW